MPELIYYFPWDFAIEVCLICELVAALLAEEALALWSTLLQLEMARPVEQNWVLVQQLLLNFLLLNFVLLNIGECTKLQPFDFSSMKLQLKVAILATL